MPGIGDKCGLESAAEQAQHHADADPCRRFFALLVSALSSGRAHLLSAAGGRPFDSPDAWGWRQSGPKPDEWMPQGRSIGWIDGDDIFLEPDAAYATANALAAEQGDSMMVTPRTLHKRLAERGLLANTDSQRGHLQVRKTFAGIRRNVLHLSAKRVLPAPETVPIGPIDPNVEKHGTNGPIPWDGSVNVPENRPTESAQLSGKNPVSGSIGPIGTVSETHKTSGGNTPSNAAGRKTVRIS